MYGSDATLRDMVRSDPITSPAKNARLSGPRDILGKYKVTLGWIMWQVAQEQLSPQEAAWAMCPDVNPMSSGFIKLAGHTELVLRNWLGFFRECGPDTQTQEGFEREIKKIWGKREDRPCHLRPKK